MVDRLGFDNQRDAARPNRGQTGSTTIHPEAHAEVFHEFLMEFEPWYRSLARQIRELIRPVKLPPLKLTSQPVPVKDIWGDYRYGRIAGETSALVHAILLALILIPFGSKVVEVVKKEIIYIPVELSPYRVDLPPSPDEAGGGGGGGDRSPEPASKGALPEFSMQQLAPPVVIIRNPKPELPVKPTVIVPPQIMLPSVNIAQLGDPMGQVSVPSSGSGSGGGIGSGGVGSGKGPGVGPGEGGGIGGGVFRAGSGVTMPQVLLKVDPEYSEQARKAKYQGTVVLSLVVQSDGSVRDIKVVEPLGLGLDEKAIEAVKQWRFRPGMKSGQPVNVAAIIEVTFRLL